MKRLRYILILLSLMVLVTAPAYAGKRDRKKIRRFRRCTRFLERSQSNPKTLKALVSSDAADKASDSDGDGVPDSLEGENTDACKADSDGDGINDGTEVEDGTDAANPDTDGDGLSDGEESNMGTDPNNSDSDGDGVDDSHDNSPEDPNDN